MLTAVAISNYRSLRTIAGPDRPPPDDEELAAADAKFIQLRH